MSRASDDVRVYVVVESDTGRERLLRAVNKSRAVRMSATARIATQTDMERLLSEGVPVESQVPSPRPPRRPKAYAHRQA
jgi:hypothetical protein